MPAILSLSIRHYAGHSKPGHPKRLRLIVYHYAQSRYVACTLHFVGQDGVPVSYDQTTTFETEAGEELEILTVQAEKEDFSKDMQEGKVFEGKGIIPGGGNLKIGKVVYGGKADSGLKEKLKSVNISLDEKSVKGPKSFAGQSVKHIIKNVFEEVHYRGRQSSFV
ncbi:hypothetical protein CEXT_106441 [Caerostris extrusa]|uniref:Uncharacterized protein n=1 Tax=Caerostris extrusa TaxID=172846 RepID=A0AAV4NSR1_CAEEX|nr:hypothetical protein CEXT_106441 [Caerostris extrusa]